MLRTYYKTRRWEHIKELQDWWFLVETEPDNITRYGVFADWLVCRPYLMGDQDTEHVVNSLYCLCESGVPWNQDEEGRLMKFIIY